MTAPPPRPVVVRVIGAPGSGKSTLIVTLAHGLRRRGYRVGSVERREDTGGGTATVLVLGSGARVTLGGVPPLEVLRGRAAALDPALDVLLAEGYVEPGLAAIEILEGEGGVPSVAQADLVATVARGAFAAAFAEHGPAGDLGLVEVLVERLLWPVTNLEGVAVSPIETSRRLISPLRADEPATSPPEAPRKSRGSWLDRLRRR